MFEGLLRQDYPAYDVKIVVDQPTDPAWHKAHEVVARHSAGNVQIEPLSERLETCSLKGSSLAQAVSRLDASYRVVAFLDGDTIPHPTWLRELVAPLEDEGVGVASGNRWYVLGGPHWGTLVRYVWNCAAVVQMYWNRFTWGGSLALRAEIARHPDLIARWRSAVSTDTVILRVVRAEGFRTAFVPSLIMTNREGCRLRDFFVWVQRQLAVGRLYHSGWYAVLGHGFVATAVPVAAVGTLVWKLAQRQWGRAWPSPAPVWRIGRDGRRGLAAGGRHPRGRAAAGRRNRLARAWDRRQASAHIAADASRPCRGPLEGGLPAACSSGAASSTR